MTNRLARRIAASTATEIALVLAAIVFAGALLAFDLYVRALSNELAGTLAQLRSALAQTSLPDARAGGNFAASLLLGTGTEIVFLDANTRVTVYRLHRSDPRPTVTIRSRVDLSGDPTGDGALAHAVVGLATAFGLQPLRAQAGSLFVVVKANEATLVATVRSFLLPLLVALALAVGCAILLARTLAQRAVAPLEDVTTALGRFASGDLTPQPIAADVKHDLAALAAAYNGAVAQMARAFGERDRANAAMHQFIADAGHQLRTPLTVVQGFIAILRRGGFDNPVDRDRILDTMYDQSRIMGALIDKLLLLERWESPEEPAAAGAIDIGRLVGDLVGPIADAHPQRHFSISAQGGILAAIDPTELGHVVTNLTDNALKYGRGEIAVRVRSENGAAVIEIADQGPGISHADAARVFDRFYRGEQRDVPGSGLGLAIVKRAVERAKGSVTLDSSSDGSRFIVQLPRV